MAAAGEWSDGFTSRRTVRAGDLEFLVAEAGDRARPTVLLLHGNPDTHTVWSAVVSRLRDRFHCVAPDLPGYGGTRAPEDLSLALDAQGEQLGALLDALGLGRVHLVVHDVGGAYGLSFATLHPERLASLTITNTTFFPDYRWHFWARVWRTRGLGNVAMALASRMLFLREMRRGSPGIPLAYARQAWEEWTPTTRRHVLRWYRAMDPQAWQGWDQRLLAALATVPTLVLWGDLDPYLPSSTADRFGGTVRHVANAGHWVMAEDPHTFAAALADHATAH